MKITEKCGDGTIIFGALSVGDVFRSDDDGFYICCPEIYDSDEKTPFNAVNFATGLFRFFKGNEKVKRIENVELVVEV